VPIDLVDCSDSSSKLVNEERWLNTLIVLPWNKLDAVDESDAAEVVDERATKVLVREANVVPTERGPKREVNSRVTWAASAETDTDSDVVGL